MAAPNLEKILHMGAFHDDSSRIAKAFYEHPVDYNLIGEYVQKYIGRTEEEKKKQSEEMKNWSPARVRENMDINTKKFEGEFVKAVSESYTNLVNTNDPQMLETIALGLSGVGEKVAKVMESAQKGDIKTIQEIYLAQYKGDPTMEHFAKHAGKEFYLGIYPMALEMEKGKFLSHFVSVKEENGKEVPYLDTEKLKPYLLAEMEKLKDKDKNKAYLRVGKEIYGLVKRAQEQEEKAKKKEHEDKKKK